MSEPPFSLEWALNRAPSQDGCRELVLVEGAWESVVRGIYARGFYVFPIPAGDDEDPDAIPAFAIGVPVRLLT